VSADAAIRPPVTSDSPDQEERAPNLAPTSSVLGRGDHAAGSSPQPCTPSTVVAADASRPPRTPVRRTARRRADGADRHGPLRPAAKARKRRASRTSVKTANDASELTHTTSTTNPTTSRSTTSPTARPRSPLPPLHHPHRTSLRDPPLTAFPVLHPDHPILDYLPLAAAPPPALPLHAWAAPDLSGRSRKGGPARSGGPPFLESPGAEPNPGRRRGGGPLTSEFNAWRSTHGLQRIEINIRPGSRCVRRPYASHCRRRQAGQRGRITGGARFPAGADAVGQRPRGQHPALTERAPWAARWHSSGEASTSRRWSRRST
jgi:hypothetical protein